MQLLEVAQDPRRIRQFLELPVRLYAQEPNWIRPWDHDIEAVFDRKKNKKFKNGDAIRWLLTDAKGEVIGRVAAFYENEQKEDQPTGGMGFFECIDDQEAAFVLFDACRDWLASKGMEAMDGPINFGDRQQWWGLMVKGWEYEPTYQMPWTKASYIPFFENYGFQDYFRQYVKFGPIAESQLEDAVFTKAQRVYDSGEFTFRKIEKNKLTKYGSDFRTVFNAAWANFPGARAMSEEAAQNAVKAMKPIMDEDILWFAYDRDDKPAGFFIALPDINQIVKHLDGKFGLWEKILFVLHKWRGTINRTVGIVFGVTPEHQGKGLESAIAMYFRMYARQVPFYPYLSMDMNWIGDFNPKMLRFVDQLGTTTPKEYITYRYLFDRNKPFERCPKIGQNKS
jgi:GNAT superfamily N-acetyltransferase